MSDDRTIPTPAPSDLPTFTVKSEGAAIPSTVRVERIEVHRRVDKVAEAVLVMLDGDVATEDWPVSNTDAFVPGAQIEIHAGYHREEEAVFKGIVVRHAIEAGGGPSRLTVTCKDAAVRLTVARSSRVWGEATDADAIAEVVEDAGLTAEVDVDGPTHGEMVQLDAVDWDFVVARAQAVGAVVVTDDGTLRVSRPDPGADPVLSLRYGGNLLSLALATDARDQAKVMEARAWIAADQEELALEAADADVTVGNVSGAALADVAAPDVTVLRHGGALPDAELQAWADARMVRQRLSAVRGEVRIRGFAGVRPGDTVDLAGVGDRFGGTAWVGGVEHRLEAGRWTTTLEIGLDPEPYLASRADASPSAGHLLPPVHGLTVGVVQALADDPGEAFRIAVRLPLVSPDTDVWARLATPDAGDGRGMVFRPEKEDEVIVGFLADDPRQPVVLGSLHGPAHAPPIDADDENPEKGFVTRGGHRITIDDDKGILTLLTEGKQSVVLDDAAGSLTLTDANDNSVTLSDAGIAVESASDLALTAAGDVTIEGVNVTIAAQAEATLDAGAQATLSSSGPAVVSGTPVQIN